MADFTTFKREASFVAEMVWTPAAGEPANLIGCTVTSAVLDADRKRHELVVTNPSADGINYLVRQDETDDWAVGTAYWDVRIYNGSSIVYTTTWNFTVIPQVTKGG